MLWLVWTVCFAFSLIIRLAHAVVDRLITVLSCCIYILLLLLGCGLNSLSTLKRGYEFLRIRWFPTRIVQVVDCERCEVPRDQASSLESELLKSRCNNTAYCNNIRRALNERIVELEHELCETNAELERTSRFLRVAEGQANEQRVKIRSLEEELRQVRDDNNPDTKESDAVQEDLERLQQQNAQLRANNLRQWNHTLAQRQRAIHAQNESDGRGDKIRLLANRCRSLQRELDDMRRQLQHQTRRADEQREARIRLEVENEEPQRPRTVAR